MLQISELYIYPIKSLAGIILNKATVTDRGFEYDRRWMLVDENHRFLSQREISQMALLKVAITDNGLLVTDAATTNNILIPFLPLTNKTCEVTIWDDTCIAVYVNDEADVWFTNILGLKCRLVYMPDTSNRQVDENYAAQGHITSFSDAYPFMMISQATLDDLNNRLNEPVNINRFRPNIVFTGGEAFIEDTIGHFTVGYIDFYGVKLCARCNIPGIDQTDATVTKEPLKSLAKYRRKNNNIYLGQNLIHNGEGIITVGDVMEIEKYHHNNERFII